jgi:hypothetical protein
MEKLPSLIGKSTMNGPFSIVMLNYQRVSIITHQLMGYLMING